MIDPGRNKVSYFRKRYMPDTPTELGGAADRDDRQAFLNTFFRLPTTRQEKLRELAETAFRALLESTGMWEEQSLSAYQPQKQSPEEAAGTVYNALRLGNKESQQLARELREEIDRLTQMQGITAAFIETYNEAIPKKRKEMRAAAIEKLTSDRSKISIEDGLLIEAIRFHEQQEERERDERGEKNPFKDKEVSDRIRAGLALAVELLQVSGMREIFIDEYMADIRRHAPRLMQEDPSLFTPGDLEVNRAMAQFLTHVTGVVVVNDNNRDDTVDGKGRVEETIAAPLKTPIEGRKADLPAPQKTLPTL